MPPDLVDLYDRATAWTASKIPAAAKQLDAKTPCEKWTVKDLLNHIVGVQKLFEDGATGKSPSGPPAGMPPEVISDDPAADYEAGRKGVVDAYKQDGAVDKGAMILGIGVVDQLVHGWDLAKATGQDETMPEDIAEVAFSTVNGMMDNPEQRGDSFKPRVEVPDDANAQDKLIGYMGRNP
jgi:uncharacterized protein (TIGR03086 family)